MHGRRSLPRGRGVAARSLRMLALAVAVGPTAPWRRPAVLAVRPRPREEAGDLSPKALLPFTATSVIWGSSFLFIRVAVEHMPPSAVVFGRTLLGTAFLVPLALRNQAFRGLRRAILPVVVVTLLDMALPTFLTAWGEQHVSS